MMVSPPPVAIEAPSAGIPVPRDAELAAILVVVVLAAVPVVFTLPPGEEGLLLTLLLSLTSAFGVLRDCCGTCALEGTLLVHIRTATLFLLLHVLTFLRNYTDGQGRVVLLFLLGFGGIQGSFWSFPYGPVQRPLWDRNCIGGCTGTFLPPLLA